MMTSPNIDDNGGERLRHVARIDEYRKFVETADSGLFTRKTRRRLVGKLGLSGRGLTKNDFWLDQRNRVKNALKDLEIFLMVAGSKNIRQTFTFENVKPFLGALLWSNSVENDASSNIQIALIAQYLVESGFTFLTNQNALNVTHVHERAISDAVDISKNLAAQMIPMEQRPYYASWFDRDEPIDHKKEGGNE